MNYRRKEKKSENYLEALLKIFQPFVEPVAVPVFAFEQQIQQWKARQKKREEELENNVQGKREHPSNK